MAALAPRRLVLASAGMFCAAGTGLWLGSRSPSSRYRDLTSRNFCQDTALRGGFASVMFAFNAWTVDKPAAGGFWGFVDRALTFPGRLLARPLVSVPVVFCMCFLDGRIVSNITGAFDGLAQKQAELAQKQAELGGGVAKVAALCATAEELVGAGTSESGIVSAVRAEMVALEVTEDEERLILMSLHDNGFGGLRGGDDLALEIAAAAIAGKLY